MRCWGGWGVIGSKGEKVKRRREKMKERWKRE
jgi:hypothetical protein